MGEKETSPDREPERQGARPRPDRVQRDEKEAPETSRHPAPGIEHEPEPSAGNLIPAEDQPGTL